MITIKQIYDKMAEEYDELVTPCRICQFLTLAYELDLRGNERVLEVGSGPGAFSLHLARVLPEGEVVGLDLSDSMIELANERSRGLENVSFTVGNALKMDIPDESFDVVVTVHVMPWVSSPKKFLSEINRVLRPGGRVGIITWAPEMYNEFDKAFKKIAKKYGRYYGGMSFKDVIGAKIFTEEELEEIMGSEGFRVKRNFMLQIKEPLTPERYIERVATFSGERYLEPVPEKDRVRKEIRGALANMDLRATECGVFMIGIKE